MPEYVVLQKRQVVVNLVEPLNTDEVGTVDFSSARETWVPIMNQRAEEGPDGEVRRFDAKDEDAAIDAYAHDADGNLEWPGTYKAVAVRNWSGSVTLEPETVTARRKSAEE